MFSHPFATLNLPNTHVRSARASDRATTQPTAQATSIMPFHCLLERLSIEILLFELLGSEALHKRHQKVTRTTIGRCNFNTISTVPGALRAIASLSPTVLRALCQHFRFGQPGVLSLRVRDHFVRLLPLAIETHVRQRLIEMGLGTGYEPWRTSTASNHLLPSAGSPISVSGNTSEAESEEEPQSDA